MTDAVVIVTLTSSCYVIYLVFFCTPKWSMYWYVTPKYERSVEMMQAIGIASCIDLELNVKLP